MREREREREMEEEGEIVHASIHSRHHVIESITKTGSNGTRARSRRFHASQGCRRGADARACCRRACPWQRGLFASRGAVAFHSLFGVEISSADGDLPL